MPYTIEAMEKLEHKSLITDPYNLTYSYYLSPKFHETSDPSTPTLVFFHGYPDDAYMWAGAVPAFLDLPYPFIIFDILGFGGSSKPTDATKYNYRNQANSIAQVLDHEKVPDTVIPIGHDWGSLTAQRFYLYNRHRCIGLTLLSLAYQAPSPDVFDLAEQNRLTTQRFGYPQWEYWNFFTSPDAAELMRQNIERFYEVNHGVFPSSNPEEGGRDVWMREMFCVPGAMREYVTQTGKWKDRRVELKPYAKDPAILRRFKERMCKDGFEAPVLYYHCLKDNTNLEDERKLCEEEEGKKITVPVLYIGDTGDWVCRTDLMGDAVKAGLVTGGLEEKVVEAGHWVLYEKPDEIAGLIKAWLIKKFPVKP